MPGAIKSASVKIEGLTEFRKSLAKLDDPGFTAGLKDVNFAVGQLVVSRARTMAAAIGPMQRKAAESLNAGRQAARAIVSGGGNSTAFFGGAEFGGSQPQFKPWRGNKRDAGYFLYPTIRDATDDIVELYGKGVDDLTRAAFPS